ncbi:MAG: type III pantothenate kinase [Deltaproteobacteria bacterium]|nr:type III pantothenate kinase [Deltaproteobacteria bacterium]
MLLALDVGNTNTVLGLYDGAALQHSFRVESSKGRTADEHLVLLLTLLDVAELARSAVHATIIASVVPSLTETISIAVRRAFGHEPVIVGPGVRTGMPILYENPREVGADRIANAVAAFERVKAAVVVVDFGTGTNFDCVNGKGEFVGGVIAPGLNISAEALFSRAARLARIPIQKPTKVIGRNTTHSVQSGIVFGYVGLVDGLVDRIRTELGPVRVLATGGLASLIAPESRTIEEVLPDLTLDGLRILYERNLE